MGSSRLSQITIYAGKCFRIFRNEKGWTTFLSSALITLIISSVVSKDMFKAYSATRNGAFALVCACIWIGIFNSIQSICKERDIIKREHRSGLHMSAYVASHMLFEMFLCLVESLIVTIIITIFRHQNLPSSGVLLPCVIELEITFFLAIYCSDILGLMTSSIVKTPVAAMTVMPFILIIQLVMSGMSFKLQGFAAKVANITVSKWSLNAICITSNVNDMLMANPDLEADYEYTVTNLLHMWGILALFILIYGIIAIISLEFVDKDKR